MLFSGKRAENIRHYYRERIELFCKGAEVKLINTKIKILQSPTSSAWLDLAIASLDTILLDHAHCELKAASGAINLMFRYPRYTKLVKELTEIAREELEHFDRCQQWLEKRGISFTPLDAPPYGSQLKSQIRRAEPSRLLDSLLISALIEARSHERLGLLAARIEDRELAKFYSSLVKSESRHYGIYWVLADTFFARNEVAERLEELARGESEILSTLHPEPRIHS